MRDPIAALGTRLSGLAYGTVRESCAGMRMFTGRSAFLVLATLAACGDNIHLAADAGADAARPPVDAAPLPVTLTVTRGDTPMVGVRVYFQNADSSLVSAASTDANGTASAVMAPGGFVTAIDPFALPVDVAANDDIRTLSGVQPGDMLTLHQVVLTSITVEVILPPDPNEPVGSYHVVTTCGSGSVAAQSDTPANPVVFLTLQNCNGVADIEVVSEDAQGHPLLYFYEPNTPVADTATLDFTNDVYLPVTARTYTYNDVPAPAVSIEIQDMSFTQRGMLYSTEGVATAPGAPQIAFDQNTVLTATFSGPEPANTNDLVSAQLITGGFGVAQLVDWGPYAMPLVADVSSRLLPTFTANPGMDVTAHQIGMPDTPNQAMPDFCVADINVARGLRTWSWMIAAPYSSVVTLPLLPTDVFDFNIQATDDASVTDWTDIKTPGGYDAMRPVLLSNNEPITSLAVGTTGSATLERWGASIPDGAKPHHRLGSAPGVSERGL